MPENEVGKLQRKIKIKCSAWRDRFYSYTCRLLWEGENLEYYYVGWKKVSFRNVLKWKVEPASSDADKRICLLLRKGETSATKWTFEIPDADFASWLYWLLISVDMHSGLPIYANHIKKLNLKKSQKRNIQTHSNISQFDALHELFVNSVERFESGKRLNIGRNKESLINSDRTGTYKIKSKLGSGGAGDIFHTDRLIGDKAIPFVVKAVSMTKNESEDAKMAIREARVLAAIGEHPNIIKMMDVVASSRCVYIFLEKGVADFRKFFKKKKLPQKYMLTLTMEILNAFKYIHKHGIYHLDMKPDNVLIFGGMRAKLIDFGLAVGVGINKKEKILGDHFTFPTKPPGTPGYFPPETWGASPQQKIDEIMSHLEKRDSYAVGMTILDSMIGPMYTPRLKYPKGLIAPPHPEKEARKNEWWRNKLEDKIENNGTIVDDIIILALKMIRMDNESRLTATQALAELEAKYGKIKGMKLHPTNAPKLPPRPQRRPPLPNSGTRTRPKPPPGRTVRTNIDVKKRVAMFDSLINDLKRGTV